MNLVDLHVHSNASDGTLTPTEVVSLAVKKKLSAIALTDHDTIDGLLEAMEASHGQPVEIIPGIELSCVYKGQEIHILGLFVDFSDPDFTLKIHGLKNIRDKRNQEMIRRFQDSDMMITLEEVTAGNPETVITRAHFARVLYEKGYVTSMDQAFKKYLTYGSRFAPERKISLQSMP